MKKIPAYAVLIVTYNGESSIIRLIRHLFAAESQVPLNILMVDNASDDETVYRVEQANFSQLSILKNSENLGLGKAFNQGMAYFKERSMDWVLILDQDSFVTKDFFSQFEQLFSIVKSNTVNNSTVQNAKESDKKNPLMSEVSAICSQALSEDNHKVEHLPYLWNGYEFYNAEADKIAEQINTLPVVASAISSGTFYRPEKVLSLGGFKESYFIDFIDHEFHLRLLKHQHKMIWNPSAIFYHNLGISQQQDESGTWIEHPPFRYYYMARNMSHGFYCYGGLQSLRIFLSTLPEFLKNSFHHSQVPWAITANVIMGLFHAGIGRMGKK